MKSGENGKLSVSDFAKLIGVTKSGVSRAIQSGRLRKSLVEAPNGRWFIDAALGKIEWEDNKKQGARNHQKVREAIVKASGDEPEQAETMESLERQIKKYEAGIKRLKFEEAAKLVVRADEVKREWSHIANILRTKILAVPSRIRQRIPEVTDDQFFIVEDIVREALEELVDENMTDDFEDDVEALDEFEEGDEPLDGDDQIPLE